MAEDASKGAAVAGESFFRLHDSTPAVAAGPRRGELVGLATPSFTVPTSRGFPTQLRPEVWDTVMGGSTRLYQLPAGDLLIRQDTVRQSPTSAEGAQGFWPHLRGNVSYGSFRNPRLANSVFGGDAVCSIDTSGGRRKFGPKEALELQRAMRLDVLAAPAEEVPLGVGHRRASRAVQRAGEWLKEILDAKASDEALAFPWHVLAGIQGSGDVHQREKACAQAAELPVAGYWIGGLGYSEKLADRVPVLRAVAAALPPGRPRFLPLNCGAPAEVLQAVLCGVDFLEVTYPTQVAGRGIALTFSWDMPEDEAEGDESILAALLPSDGTEVPALQPVKQLHVGLPEFKEDFSPITEWSPVRNYTRAYIHHLTSLHEILGTMLLAQHNLHAYRELFAAIRLHCERGSLRRFAAWFLRTQTAALPAALAAEGPAAKRRKAG